MLIKIAYMVEVWPYMERSRGIAVFQLFGRLAGFFTTFVNPIGLGNISWKWLIVYVAWLTYEVVFVWFLFPETANRTLEELAFCEHYLWNGHTDIGWRLTCAQCSRARRKTLGRVRQWRRLLLRGKRMLLVRRGCDDCWQGSCSERGRTPLRSSLATSWETSPVCLG
jgi:hypothetical protein